MAKLVRPEDFQGRMLISSDLEAHRKEIQKFADMGFDRIYLHNVGRNQKEWIEAFGREVLPKIDCCSRARSARLSPRSSSFSPGASAARAWPTAFALLGDAVELSVIVNTGDDLELHGLHVSPDLDTVMYTLAGLANDETGWGVRDETWSAAGMLGSYGEPTWFRLGDRDLATHIVRTRRLAEGAR